MSRSITEMVSEFMTASGHEASPLLWEKLITEEWRELQEASGRADLTGMAHEAADVVYVLTGWMRSMGVDLSAVIAEVHKANMTKTNGPRRADGKIMKGPNYVPPDIAGVLSRGMSFE